MINKQWHRILFFSFLFLSILFPLLGWEYFGKGTSSALFSISVVLTILFEIWLYFEVSFEGAMKKRKLTKIELDEQASWGGRMSLKEEELIYSQSNGQEIKIKVSQIKAIGELTTDIDPVAMDWYLIIVKDDNQIIYLPAHAVGFQDTLGELSSTLHHEIMPKLYASVTFDSKVLYPASVEGKKLFEFEGLAPGNIWEKLKVNWGMKPIIPVLRQEIMEMKG